MILELGHLRRVLHLTEVVDQMEVVEYPRVEPNRHHHEKEYRGGLFVNRRNEDFSKLERKIRNVVNENGDSAKRHPVAHDGGEVEAVSHQVVDEHLLEVCFAFFLEDVLQQISEMVALKYNLHVKQPLVVFVVPSHPLLIEISLCRPSQTPRKVTRVFEDPPTHQYAYHVVDRSKSVVAGFLDILFASLFVCTSHDWAIKSGRHLKEDKSDGLRKCCAY